MKILNWFLSFFKKKKEWECYEIWRPNIPANGCSEQCKECRNVQEISKIIKELKSGR